MRALPPDIAERLRIKTVDLDPKHVKVGDRTQDFQIALGLGVEIEVEQDIDIGTCAVPDRFEMHPQITEHLAVDIDLRLKGRAEARAPAGRLALVIGEDVGLQSGELLLAHLAADRFYPIEGFDRRLVPGGMIDPPSGAVRPVDPDAVADLAAEQL